MTTLKMAVHGETGRRMVEVYDDSGEFIASIYPTQDGSNTIHVVSNYFSGDPIKSSGMIPVPGYLFHFKEKS